MTTTQVARHASPIVSDAGPARVVVAAAASLDELAGVVSAEVAAALPDRVDRLRIGVTSTAPSDDAARAARWLSRLAAQRGIPDTLVAPEASLNRLRSMRALLAGAAPPDVTPAGEATVGVSRLDLSPTTEAVDQLYALGLWPLLESPGLRLRRRLAHDPGTATVEAALAAQPVRTVLVGREHGLVIAVVGRDLLAVEVLGRALRTALQPIGDLGLSPWEAPVVQRGTELALGVTHPDRIRVEPVWLGSPSSRGHDRLHAALATATARAGIPT